MLELIPFDFERTPVRVTDQDGAPWFVLTDVCSVLGLKTPHKVVERLDDDEKTTIDTRNTNSTFSVSPRAQKITLVNESGLYSLIFTSRKPKAKEFKKWVTSEVLPTIRKTGMYDLQALWQATINKEDTETGQSLTPGQRFAEERRRLGFATHGEFAKAIGRHANQIWQFEELNRSTKDVYLIYLLTDIGFDYRYWQTGTRSPFRPISLEESALLRAWRYGDRDRKCELLKEIGGLAEVGYATPLLDGPVPAPEGSEDDAKPSGLDGL